MALQHFYSRVPFRISMFNKADGYDTFACSEGLDREYIDKELSVVCEIKLTPEELVQIRKGEYPDVYCQYTAGDGSLVQSCTTFYPLDYTGERSTYLVHNLVFPPREEEALFFAPDRAAFNPEMFVHDITRFQITAMNVKPLKRYPETDYRWVTAEPTNWLTEVFDPATLQRILYATIAVLCGKIKAVYFQFQQNDTAFVLRFFNAIYSLLPYHLRPLMSFTTGVNDTARYPGIKFRCLNDNIAVPTAKGALLNFKTKQISGIRDDEISANGAIVDFFFDAVQNDAIRRDFLIFCDFAVKAVPSLGANNLTPLGNLVFLFRSSSGMFDEKTVLPTDERLTEFFKIYEKNRAALTPEFRTVAVKSLQRYSKTHTAIPKPLFAKITKIYPGESNGVKHIIMDVVLELIHTDIMRDKLFAFIKSNFSAEDDETKEVIVENLSRVFYGGFLQSQLLAFFEQIFYDSSPASQTVIMEKLLLSIRNKEVKAEILSFLKSGFTGFSTEIRHMIYQAALEHFAEGDELAGALLELINANLVEEDEAEQNWFMLKLLSAVKVEVRRRTHPLLTMLALSQGYCSEQVLRKVFAGEFGPKAYEETVAAFCSVRVSDTVYALRQAIPLFPAFDKAVSDQLLAALEQAKEKATAREELLPLTDAVAVVEEILQKETDPVIVEFWHTFSVRFLVPKLLLVIPEVFLHPDKPTLPETVGKLVGADPDARNSEGYALLVNYAKMKKAALIGDVEALVSSADKLPAHPPLRKAIAVYLKKTLVDTASIPDAAAVLAMNAVINQLKTGNFDFPGLYDSLRNPEGEEESAPADDGTRAFKQILRLGATVAVNCTGPLNEAVYADDSALGAVFNTYMQGKKGKDVKLLEQTVASVVPRNDKFITFCKQKLHGAPKPSFFSSLFGKKK